MDKRKAKVVQGIRDNMRVLGFPIDDLTDEEVERGVEQAADVASRSGLSASEAAKSMRILASL